LTNGALGADTRIPHLPQRAAERAHLARPGLSASFETICTTKLATAQFQASGLALIADGLLSRNCTH
jgi:hypothetical protein